MLNMKADSRKVLSTTDRENKPGVGIKYPICKSLILVSYYIILGVDSASNRNEYQEYFLGVKAAGA
jgi:hypothetical protein